jgi:hypothetical protein
MVFGTGYQAAAAWNPESGIWHLAADSWQLVSDR